MLATGLEGQIALKEDDCLNAMNLRSILTGPVLAAGLLVSACGADANNTASRSQSDPTGDQNRPASATVAAADAPYDFQSPDLRVELPGELLEISAITTMSNGKLAAVQDESGIVFVINPENGEVESEVQFGEPADYEGIAWSGDRLWVLRSNGRLFELNGWPGSDPNVHEIRTPLRGKNDTEGLTYDPSGNRLLIACKEEPGGNLDKDKKAIYAFDLATRSFNPDPVYVLDTKQLEESTPIDKKFKPSDVAIHPTTKEIYVLSGTVPGLVILDSSGNLKGAWKLDNGMFEQPEGLTFLPDGTLFISSEGQSGPGMLYRYAAR